MSADQRVLVVGTTPDYVDWLRKARPEKALFLTRPDFRQKAREESPSPAEEILCDVNETTQTLSLIDEHLQRWNQRLCGVVAYDCECLLPAALLAEALGLTFPGPDAIRHTRSKILTRKRWEEAGLPTPAMMPLSHPAQASGFCNHINGPVVLKPAFGSGSELVFRCDDAPSAALAFRKIHQGLAERRDAPLYEPRQACGQSILGEEYVQGPEFSCDLLLSPNKARVIRLTEKLKDPFLPFGTTLAYLLPGRIPTGVSLEGIEALFTRAALALGLTSGIAMIDFIVSDQGPCLLEMSLRPGGDCLPWLLAEALDLDTISLALDAARSSAHIPAPPRRPSPLVGLRLHARRDGWISDIVTEHLENDPRVRQVHLLKSIGDRVSLPPKDYDSWLLGHLLFTPHEPHRLLDECMELKQKLDVTYKIS